ncbi:hypothetical protein PO467_03965 [Enterobacter kobei]|uniref:hypothetical protein n=1 Tax=Enterobacter kobei TaxID=208224 RepID=UPI002FF75E4C
MSNIDKRAQKELYAKVEQQAHSLRGNPHEYQAVTGMCPVNVIEMHAQKIQALLDELEAKDNRINRLEAIVSVAEQRNELMREWKRALKVPCDLVDDQVPVVIHGMVIRLDRIKETEAKLEAVEKRNERALSLLKDASPEMHAPEAMSQVRKVVHTQQRRGRR